MRSCRQRAHMMRPECGAAFLATLGACFSVEKLASTWKPSLHVQPEPPKEVNCTEQAYAPLQRDVEAVTQSLLPTGP